VSCTTVVSVCEKPQLDRHSKVNTSKVLICLCLGLMYEFTTINEVADGKKNEFHHFRK